MSKTALQCPVCGQDAEGRRAAKRVKKWAADSRLDRFMFDKLMLLTKAHMQDQALTSLLQQQLASGTFKWNALDADRKPGEELAPRSEQTAERWAEKMRQTISRELWGDKPPPAPGFKEVQPVEVVPRSGQMSPQAQKLRAKALKPRQKLKPDGEADADQDWALNYAEKKNEKLAKDRAYNRDYYHKNKATH